MDMAEALECTAAYLAQSQEDSDPPMETEVTGNLAKEIAAAAGKAKEELEGVLF